MVPFGALVDIICANVIIHHHANVSTSRMMIVQAHFRFTFERLSNVQKAKDSRKRPLQLWYIFIHVLSHANCTKLQCANHSYSDAYPACMRCLWVVFALKTLKATHAKKKHKTINKYDPAKIKCFRWSFFLCDVDFVVCRFYHASNSCTKRYEPFTFRLRRKNHSAKQSLRNLLSNRKQNPQLTHDVCWQNFITRGKYTTMSAHDDFVDLHIDTEDPLHLEMLTFDKTDEMEAFNATVSFSRDANQNVESMLPPFGQQPGNTDICNEQNLPIVQTKRFAQREYGHAIVVLTTRRQQNTQKQRGRGRGPANSAHRGKGSRKREQKQNQNTFQRE